MIARFSSILLVLVIVHPSLGAVEVREWNGINANKWSYTLNPLTITILEADTSTFSFEAFDNSDGTPVNIDSITVNSGVSGTVKVRVAPDPGSSRSYGAATVKGINLSNANTGELAGLTISGDLGTLSGVTVDRVTGAAHVGGHLRSGFVANEANAAITIDGSVLGTIGISTVSAALTIGGNVESSTIAVSSLSATLTINGTVDSLSNITIDTATADVAILGNLNGILTAETLGNLTLQHPFHESGGHHGRIDIANSYAGTMTINFGYYGLITIDGDLSGTISGTTLDNANRANEEEGGTVTVKGDLVGGRIAFTAVTSADEAEDPVVSIDILGSVRGSRGEPLISVGTLTNTIAVRGTLFDANNAGPEIDVGSSAAGNYYRGAIAIDYDANGLDTPTAGQDDAAWRNSAKVRVGTTSYSRDQGNSSSVRVWNVRDCKGDFNSSGDAPDSTDAGLFNLAVANDEGQSGYTYLWAGLEGSRVWHGDCNFSNVFDNSADLAAFNNLVTESCCVQSSAWCGGDLDHDFDTDITDLALLLSNFGETGSIPRSDGDLDSDDDVDIQDLAFLLSQFGQTCCPSSVTEPLTGGITTTVQVFDTGAFSGGDFAGESKHFVFDVLIQMAETGDDWIGSGVIATTANSAAFRIVPDADNPPVPTSSTPNKYATFFSQPYANVNGNNRFNSPFTSGGIAGGYSPTGNGYTYTTSTIDASWYDMNSASNDGPAAVFRLVINVENVSGADVSGGLGSVYFSTTGPAQQGDIKVADMTFEPVHAYTHSSSLATTGSFYVNGQ